MENIANFADSGAKGTYSELTEQIHKEGLLERQYTYYLFKFVGNISLLAVSIAIVVLVSNPWLQMANAVFMAFVFTRFAMYMHDADHNQIFNSKTLNKITGQIIGNLILHTSSDSWVQHHLKHHASPNTLDEDPEISIPFLAYSKEQALVKKGIRKHIIGYQAYYWFPLLTLLGISLRINAIRDVLVNIRLNHNNMRIYHYFVELILTCMGALWLYALVFYFIGGWYALIFLLISYAVSGLYMGSLFATNHKGMPIISGKKPDFMTLQILTARNINGSPLVDYWTGGLNFQIEHHLFPSMPRSNLSKAAILVRKYCMDNNIEYYQTGFFYSYKEILQNFHEIGTVLRSKSVFRQISIIANKINLF